MASDNSSQASGVDTEAQRQRARRVGRDRGRAAAVAQIVDEDAPAPRGLAHGGEVALRLRLRHALGDRLGVGLGFVPIGARRDRHHDVQAPCRRRSSRSSQGRHIRAACAPHAPPRSRRSTRRPRRDRGRRSAGRAAPAVPPSIPRDGSPARSPAPARAGRRGCRGSASRPSRRRRGAAATARALPGMLGEEAFRRDARRAAHQAEHASLEVRQDPVGDVGVEFGEALLGHARLAPQDALRVGEPRDRRRRALRPAAPSRAPFRA